MVDLNGFLPFGDNSVKQVYSSHCIEHVENVYRLLNEICRVCVNRARVTITAPHFGQEMAMRPGHVGVFSEMMVTHFDEFPECWTGEKRLVMIDKAYRPTKHFDEARNLWPALSDEQIYRFIQNTCHDVTFRFKVARIAK